MAMPRLVDRRVTVPLYSEDAEQAVLSSVMIDNAVLSGVSSVLKSSDFFDSRHQLIFAAYQRIAEAGANIDPVATSEELQRFGELGSAGGKDYLSFIVDAVPTAANVGYYAKIVREKCASREVADANSRWNRDIADGVPFDEAKKRFERALAEIEIRSGAGGQRRGLPVYDDNELVALPSPRWDVPGIIPRNGLVQIHGPYGSGKTFVALDIVWHRSLGLTWHGVEIEHGPCFYVLAEGAVGARGRVAGLKKYYGVTYAGIYFIPQPVHLNAEAQVAELVAAIKERVKEGAEPWVIIDTRSRCFIGNENSTEDVSAFVRGCDRIRNETGATVIVLHHPGWGNDERGRGAYDFDASCDTIIRVERDAERVTLSCTKQKDGPDFAPMTFETFSYAQTLIMKPVELSAGKLTGQRLIALRALHDNSTDLGWSYKAWLDASSLKPSSFNKAREWLNTQGYVKSSGGKWKLTDAGHLAMRSTDSTVTPSVLHSPRNNSESAELHSQGVFTPVMVERDSSTSLRESA